MKIPFTLGICKVSIFKLSKGSQRVGQWEGSQMDEGPGKEKKRAPKQVYGVKIRRLPSTNTQGIFQSS